MTIKIFNNNVRAFLVSQAKNYKELEEAAGKVHNFGMVAFYSVAAAIGVMTLYIVCNKTRLGISDHNLRSVCCYMGGIATGSIIAGYYEQQQKAQKLLVQKEITKDFFEKTQVNIASLLAELRGKTQEERATYLAGIRNAPSLERANFVIALCQREVAPDELQRGIEEFGFDGQNLLEILQSPASQPLLMPFIKKLPQSSLLALYDQLIAIPEDNASGSGAMQFLQLPEEIRKHFYASLDEGKKAALFVKIKGMLDFKLVEPNKDQAWLDRIIFLTKELPLFPNLHKVSEARNAATFRVIKEHCSVQMQADFITLFHSWKPMSELKRIGEELLKTPTAENIARLSRVVVMELQTLVSLGRDGGGLRCVVEYNRSVPEQYRNQFFDGLVNCEPWLELLCQQVIWRNKDEGDVLRAVGRAAAAAVRERGVTIGGDLQKAIDKNKWVQAGFNEAPQDNDGGGE